MIKTFSLSPGVTLRCFQSPRFKQGCISIQLVSPMAKETAASNALIPAVLLRGTREYPDLRAITLRLDDLYGASVSALVRRIGDYQTTGLYCAFMEDRFAMEGDEILAPMVEFLRQLLLDPVMEDGGFSKEFVESEKRNLILTIESDINDKRVYANSQLLRLMCREDSFGIPRLGEKEQVAVIDHKQLYAHYRKLLSQSAVELFYVGSARPEQVAQLLKPLTEGVQRNYVNLPAQTPFHKCEGNYITEALDVTQGKLCMGFTTPITNQSAQYAAMQVCNTIFGAGQTAKLFMVLREEMSLCYSIGSGYYGSKGLLTVSAGIDFDKETQARQEILHQLELCQTGNFSDEELESAKEAILSGLRGVHDSPGAIEGYYATAGLSGATFTLDEYRDAVENVTAQQVCAAAKTLSLHTSYFLKGVTA